MNIGDRYPELACLRDLPAGSRLRSLTPPTLRLSVAFRCGVKRLYGPYCLVKSIRAGWCIRARSAAALPEGNGRISWLN